MSVSGQWNITIKTPMGNQESVLELRAEGAALSGVMIEKNGDRIELLDGTVDGNNLSWKAKVNKPMPMTIDFTASVDGNSISGTAKTPFGGAPLTGTKAG